MNNDLTDITIIMDRSGSMSPIKGDMEGGLSSFIEEQRSAEGRAKVTLIQFDDRYEEVFSGVDVNETPKIHLHPRGMTALNDALGKTISSLGDRLRKMPENERPGNVLVVIVTDGMENASREYTSDQVRDMISHQEGKYSWEFVYLGANQDAVAVASDLGIKAKNAFNYDVGKAGAMMQAVSSSVASYRSAKLVCDSAEFEMSDEDRENIS